jgi:hypothetical protein
MFGDDREREPRAARGTDRELDERPRSEGDRGAYERSADAVDALRAEHSDVESERDVDVRDVERYVIDTGDPRLGERCHRVNLPTEHCLR